MSFTSNRSFKLTKGLSLQERTGAAFYKAVASLRGRKSFFNTETTDFQRAQRLALSWFKRLSVDESSPVQQHTMSEAAKSFLADLTGKKKAYHEGKWSAVSEFWSTMDVDAVTTPVLKDFIRWRKLRAERLKRSLVPHTTHKDLVTIRRILHHAVEEGWLSAMPVFPKQERIESNPRPWLEPAEWTALVRVATERIEKAPTARSKRQRSELLDFCTFMVQTCVRVDELRSLRVRDCTVKIPKQDHLIVSGAGPAEFPQPYLQVFVNGKTGLRKTVVKDGVDVFQRLVARRDLKADDLLFKEHHRDGFRELLVEAGLRKDAVGQPRNLKCLRSTGLMFRVIANPRINLKLLSDAVGSSVAMLDQFYLKRLSVDMNVEELLS